MATTLEKAAIAALDDPAFERAPSFCQRFLRQVVQSIYGGRYNKYLKGTAHLSYIAWKDSPFAVSPDRGSVPGDILYWKATPNQPAGHVAIRVTGNKVVENSIVHAGQKRGAKGYRPLAILRKPDLIVRLPDASKP